jgi:hypothetical protein
MTGNDRVTHNHDDTDDTDEPQRGAEKGGETERIRYNPSRTTEDKPS